MSIPAHKKLFGGFTLIELLIVIAILGILAAAVLVAVNPAKRQRQARDSARKNDIGQLATALQAYYTTPGQGQYPGPDGYGVVGGLATLTASGDLKQIPAGPSSGGEQYYLDVNANSTEAAIYATLEDPVSSGFVGGTAVWCWQSTTGRAAERQNTGACTP